MQIRAIKTDVVQPNANLQLIIATALADLPEYSILAISSKVLALSEGSIDPLLEANEQSLVRQDADWYYYPKPDKQFAIAITHNALIPNAGIDPAGDWFVHLPANPQASANQLRTYVCKQYRRKFIGVIITDTTTRPLQRGTTGIALAHSGFAALRKYKGEVDVFGRPLEFTQANHAQALAAAAVAVMGEGSEQTPLAVIADAPFVQFQNRNPSIEELAALRIAMQDDVYAPLLIQVDWQRGVRR